jgi:hypothetical protein
MPWIIKDVKFILEIPASRLPLSSGMLEYCTLLRITPPEKWFHISDT